VLAAPVLIGARHDAGGRVRGRPRPSFWEFRNNPTRADSIRSGMRYA
jgi:hypothetical protein